MNLEPFTGPGSTPARRRFWEAARSAVMASQKIAGRNVTVDEHQGKGSVINVPDRKRDCGGCVCIDTVEIVDGGSGYLVGNRLSPVFGTACVELGPFQLLVSSVDGSGAVTAVVPIPGGGYLVPPSNPISFAGALGSGFTANCTFACTTGPLPCPDSVSIEFHDVIFDCGCVDTGSGTSSMFTAGTFNDNPSAWSKRGNCGNSCFWGYDSPGGGCPSGTFTTHFQKWDNSD